MAESLIYEKSYAFALRIVKLYKYLCEEKNMYLLAKQVLRSGTSIGANVAEALSAQTRKEFLSKIFISLKETRETGYWLKLLHDSGYLETDHFDSIYQDNLELLKILSSIAITTRQKDQSQSIKKGKQIKP